MRRGVIPQSGYGMTETCSHRPPLATDDPKLIAETCGRSCSGYEIRIWDQQIPTLNFRLARWGRSAGAGRA